MNEWNIQARARVCQGCGRSFADQENYHTLLFETRRGFERLDVCGTCWEGQHQHGAKDRKGFISHWQGVFCLPPAAPAEAIQKDSAESLLRRLTERNDEALQPAAFILAVMLERKRVLKMREQLRQGGRRTLVYELPATGELFTIPDPQLRLDQLEQVQRDVAMLLEQGLPEPPPMPQPREEPFVTEEAHPTPGSVPTSPALESASP